ncbi:helix-turn-helix transcriptional regulator [Methylobacterium durans]|uniref:helix-turn-helix domain-containing protein n=1 Tax=Methylobacterium durans TaxID=2202825 RepID=UPI002AFE6261|nr:helix-turn-helix transcriptional regulator [Methylobacterium durans]MEA1835182.1 helix-turn-helix transcriptional regulator [Methylobacterium durans]
MPDETPLFPDQCRAARALIRWSRARLSQRCGVSATTVAEFEAGKREPFTRTLVDVRRALEEGGVTFIPPDGSGGPGVRLQPLTAGA